MTVERANYQMFHFCEMARMIQSQSASLAFFFELIMKAYNWIKEKVGGSMKSFYLETKLKIIEKLRKMKVIIKEFFQRSDLEDDKLRKHIKALDYILTILIFMTVAGIFLRVYKFELI
jgi:hypothetical protein